jgi:transposase-like protein
MALDNGAKRGGRDGRKAAAREKVFELRLAGVPFRAIGKEVGVSHTYAMRLYREALSERSKHVEELKDLHVTV